GLGFIVDVSAMTLLSVVLQVIPARAGAFWVAASFTWWCNRQFTFKEANKSAPLRQWFRFLLTACVGFIPNWGCYWALIRWVDDAWITQLVGESGLYFWPLVAMIPGILLGMVVNFSLASRWVYRPALA
ncbi:GtrA family protein, partial [Photobacterium sp. OFAV2-7]|uniref:GtrA family protein n=1 Tax=Photobacterium sp. OFAV2-7 TaxID=2917748 RepID=UPI001EF737E9